MTDYSNRTKHNVYLGNLFNGELVDPRQAGHALNFTGTDYFVLKLWERSKETYFISKNQNDEATYTVYAKRVEDELPVKFQNPIGKARMKNDLKNYLEIYLDASRVKLFMNLFPAN